MVEARTVSDPHRAEVRAFLALALGLRFETRFASETKWWPASVFEVAEALVPYYQDAEACLDRMLDGEEVCTRLEVYRVAIRR